MTLSFTAQTRLHVLAKDVAFLKAYAGYMSMVERRLFARMFKGEKLSQIKKSFLPQYQITARQFNGIRVSVEGKIKSRKECQVNQRDQLKESISSKKKWLKSKGKQLPKMPCPQKRQKLAFSIHHKKRKLHQQEIRLDTLVEEIKNGVVKICFGTKKLFKKQFNLVENEYNTFADWKKDWLASRSNSLFFIGSKDETAGNQTCSLIDNRLRIRVPNKLTHQYGKYYLLPVSYSFGQAEVDAALLNKQALTHRFLLKECAVYLYTTVDIPESPIKTAPARQNGVLGIDFNANNIAICNVDRYGNFLASKTIPAHVANKSTAKTKAIYGDIVKDIVLEAKQQGKPIACEALDFKKKKRSIKEEPKRYARMLSSLAYSMFFAFLFRKAAKEGVKILPVNPAYTSLIGKAKFMGRYGMSSHESAAMAIARRAQNYSEKVPARNACTPLVKMAHQHVWKLWSFISKDKVIRKNSHQLFYSWQSLQDTTGFIQQRFLSYGEILQRACGAKVKILGARRDSCSLADIRF